MAALEKGFAYRILVADDDPAVLETSAKILRTAGYEVRTAVDGFDALAELRRSLPDVIISDLRMPNMSGFEFLSIVRRRFPHIPVIAISAEFNGTAPVGLIADGFFSKGEYGPQELFRKIRELIEGCPLRPQLSKPDKAPVWIPRSEAGYFVVTCTECLRSFSIPEEHSGSEVHETTCLFCETKVSYLADLHKGKKHPRKTA
jgi:CheY-like chemotaxis protein